MRPPDIVCSVVDRELSSQEDCIVDNAKRVSLFIREKIGVVAVETLVEKPTEEVNTKLGNKVLDAGEKSKDDRV